VAAAPAVRDRTFTLIDAVRRAEDAPPRTADEDLRTWAARIGAGRTAAAAVGDGDDEVADPVGSSVDRYRETRALLRDLLTRLADRAWPATAVAPSPVERSA
jgi:hypothetical protein